MKVCRFVRGGRTQLGLALDEGAVIGLDDIFLEAGLELGARASGQDF
jgi:hypothetical protein